MTTKVVKLMLISKVTNAQGEELEYKESNRCLWDLQRETRDLKNNTIRECWEWYGFSNDYNKRNNEYPKEREHLLIEQKDGTVKDYSLDGFIYAKYAKAYNLYSSNMSASERAVTSVFKKDLKKMLKGEKSIPSFRENQPIDVANKCIILDYDKESNSFSVTLQLLNKAGKELYNINDFRFEPVVEDKSTRTILERCYDKIYKISASKLIYDKKKRQWRLNLSYSLDSVKPKELDKDKILGVNLGIVYPMVASVNGDKRRLIVDGGEVEEFRRRVESRRNSLKKQAAVCGDGRIGHGYKTRMKPVLNISDKIARFRDTYNHKLSRRLIEYAVSNNCGTIQMENLKGISDNEEKPFLKNWSYFDLQTKIEYKAKEQGINVIYVDPAYTSLRCSKCGLIHEGNHPTREKFICQHCGFSILHDYNASQNIALKGIEAAIDTELKKMGLRDEDGKNVKKKKKTRK